MRNTIAQNCAANNTDKRVCASPEHKNTPPQIVSAQLQEHRQTFPSAGFEPLLSAQQAGALLNLHEKTVQGFARAGILPAVRIGKAWRFRASALDAWVNQQIDSEKQSRRESGKGCP